MSLGLSQITNNAEATIKFIEKYGQYFDKWFITVADKDKKQYDKLLNSETFNVPKAELTYFKWCDDFAKARNFNLEQIDTDYWMWADSDDEIVHPERITDVIKFMQDNDVDVMNLKYDYAQDESGRAISDHWRERIIKRSYEGKWDAPVHETLQGPPAIVEQLNWVEVKHKKEALDVRKSMERNKRILAKHFKETSDPRDASYLGMTMMSEKNYKSAIQWFLQHIQTSGSDEDKYRSWCRIADSEWILENYDQALYATDEAIKLKPNFPDAYYIKVLVYTSIEAYDKGIEWLKVAMSKPVPETLAMIDPTLYQYRGMAMGAMCYLFSGRVKEAFRLYQAVIKEAPDFYKKENEETGIDWPKMYEDSYFDQKAVDYIKWLLHYTKGTGGNPIKLFESLSPRMFADPRLNVERVNFIPKKKWPEKSIVFFCGQATEPWGPDTLAKGMGGSEEAIVYLSRELAKLGWQVTVFNDREEEYVDGFGELFVAGQDMADNKWFQVTYKPWTLFNPQDEFDVFVGWRIPQLTRGIKARKKAVDLHDCPVGHATITNADVENTDVFMFKSKFQTTYAPNVPKEKQVIVGNGIVRSQFDE